jgi:hypothetical protein
METKTNKPQLFKPGEGGRPKGAKNKITREIQAKVEWVLELLDETIEEDLMKMKAPERVKLWTDLQEYIRPKLQRVNLDVGAEDKEIRKVTFVVVGEAEHNAAKLGQEGNK